MYQLGNGNIMWTSGGGVFVFDVGLGTSTNVYTTTGGRYVDLVTIPEPAGMAIIGVVAMFCGRRPRSRRSF